MSVKRPLGLSAYLIRQVILPLLLLILTASAVQLWLIHGSLKAQTEHFLAKQTEQMLPALAKALYDADVDGISLLGDSLFKDRQVLHLMISDQFSRVYLRTRNDASGFNFPSSLLVVNRPVSYETSNGQRLLMGNIAVHYRMPPLFSTDKSEWYLIVLVGIFKITLPLLAMFLFLRNKIQLPLQRLMDGLKQVKPGEYHDMTGHESDALEIKSLNEAYNLLQANNHHYHERQQEVHNKLVERNQQVAESRESARLLTTMLQSSQKRYRALFHRNVDALLIVEPFRLDEVEHYRIIDANLAAVKVLDQPLDNLINQDFEMLFGTTPKENGQYRLGQEQVAPISGQRSIQIDLHFNMVLFEKHSLFYVTLRDVTDSVRAEKLEKEANELMNFRQNQMAIAEMATTIAHEVNQPLASIQNYALSAINFSQKDPIDREKIIYSLQQLVKQADVASGIVQQARSQLGRNDYPQEVLNLTELIRNTIDLCSLRAEKCQIKIQFHTQLNQAWIIGNDIQLKQVFINLISNAIEVLIESKQKGRITLSLKKVRELYEVGVLDNGPGIYDIKRVFTTHYTTKKNGLGMGLAICRSITEIHQGSIHAENHAEGGAYFTVRLPMHTAEAVISQSLISTAERSLLNNI
ncbi:Histidine kinase-, DNA gyrase B-, and HSP90-like ATPase [Oceanospirillum multiglobuliferum]|uniref:sensor histidine kinase n=1 Tax=Oceanospirillum multiglobuliferum TaxID=64969 RepID=UPI000999E609|nr:sensor histidine kinase [Oceanospirillum multiglobuliferum]SJZ85038.1 Histidine kinase-, DNA gyrase B-, and HSP90-like ATPase [Oceanospirillum multiglobuliferum]